MDLFGLYLSMRFTDCKVNRMVSPNDAGPFESRLGRVGHDGICQRIWLSLAFGGELKIYPNPGVFAVPYLSFVSRPAEASFFVLRKRSI